MNLTKSVVCVLKQIGSYRAKIQELQSNESEAVHIKISVSQGSGQRVMAVFVHNLQKFWTVFLFGYACWGYLTKYVLEII